MADNSLEIRTRVRMAQWQSIIKECKESGIDYHNLHNIITSQEQVYTTFSHSDELKDTKSGWLNSRYICLGNIPLGIYDSKTLDPIKKPHLEIETDTQGGLKCQFDLIDEGFIFFLGNDQWYGHTTMLGYKCSDMTAPCARLDDISVNSDAFTQALERFIAERAIKIVATQRKIQEKQYEKKRA